VRVTKLFYEYVKSDRNSKIINLTEIKAIKDGEYILIQ
jgi:hypothetical protein